MIKKVLQIVPAQPGWVARFRQDNDEMLDSPVAVWAIIKDENGDQRIVGFSEPGKSFEEPDDEAGNFDGWYYVSPQDTKQE